jgi:hypothetical protein
LLARSVVFAVAASLLELEDCLLREAVPREPELREAVLREPPELREPLFARPFDERADDDFRCADDDFPCADDDFRWPDDDFRWGLLDVLRDDERCLA